MKIATWNIERLEKRKNEEVIYCINQIDADILILTETSILIDLSKDYKYQAATTLLHNINNIYKEDERRVIIYSKYPIEQSVKTYEDETTRCVEIKTPIGNLFVYGTIIGIYGNRKKCFLTDLEKQIVDINKIVKDGSFCLVGDLNISFSDNYYFTQKGREKLNILFSKCNLTNLTEDVSQNIDHIVISENFLKGFICKTIIWNKEKLLSDHIGVCVELAPFKL